MRFTSLLALVPFAASLATLVTARGYEQNDARDYIDELSLREDADGLSTRELLSELSTRELIGELSDRLERRTKYGKCKYCKKKSVIKGDSCSEHVGGHVLE
ncbi:ectomycorrhizas-regulated small secreted protein [Ephemerocybe angulata]|uniref:Ectomycorrhizas-regulated small secreted protein n=1 Tax=Ephemerocybe angulata TaxID=980116 RepID=A0A8H6M803_9AGAR|nr:ectomycorrhizas-regulated small secreted protein [Tulosesus angulatus]